MRVTRIYTGPNGETHFVEDTEGRGHRTRTVDGRVRRSLFIPLPSVQAEFIEYPRCRDANRETDAH